MATTGSVALGAEVKPLYPTKKRKPKKAASKKKVKGLKPKRG